MNQHLIHGGNPRCLDHDPARKELFVSKCDDSSLTQRWLLEKINESALANWDKAGVDAVDEDEQNSN